MRTRMNMKAGRLLLLASTLLLAGLSGVWAQAEFVEVSGKVEVRRAGAAAWEPATPGMRIANDTTISTGFNANASLRMGASTVVVEQLTRLVFEEIVQQDDAVQTRLNLNAGRMSAQVRSADGRRQDFQVRSPISTAAVRGTDFAFDGERLEVQEGEVGFSNAFGQERSVSGGQRSTAGGAPGAPRPPSEEVIAEVTTSVAPIGAGSDDEAGAGVDKLPVLNRPRVAPFGRVIIEIQ